MKKQARHFILLALLALVFTIGLTFASVELPRLLDTVIAKTIDTPDVATGFDPIGDYKTDLYLRATRLRPIGYMCLALILILIAAGFATERTGWTSAGAILLFLPVFGHFAATMFFLGGLGFLRLLWLPFLDASFGLFRLADIINLPYSLFLDLYAVTGLGRWLSLSRLITGLGLLIFFLGTWTWFYARSTKKGVADLWVYRLSRHPQYLGWIIWSYGILFLPGSRIKLGYELSNSLPWLLSTVIIIGIAMLEEIKMKRAFGDVYDAYRRKAPFLIPLPRFIARASGWPLRLMFKKPYPERKKEIAAVLAFYAVLVLGISAAHGAWISRPAGREAPSAQRVDELARVLKDAADRGEKRRAAGILAGMGEPAVDPLIALLKDPDASVRAYAAEALGGTKSERAVSPLAEMLNDGDSYVRRTAAEALGNTGSSRALRPLVKALEDPTKDIARAAVRGLGLIPGTDVLPMLIRALRNDAWNAAADAAQALGERGARGAIEPLVQCFEETPNCPYDRVGTALWKLGSDRAVDAWIAGLKKGWSLSTRAFCAAEIGKNKLENGLPALRDALKDESPEVRRAAVLALMEFRSEATIGALRGVLKDEDFEVRLYAKEALKTLSAAPAADVPPDLESILKNYNAALGGKEAIEAIRTRTLGGELTHDFPGQDPPHLVLPAEVLSAAPDKWRLILKTPGGLQQLGSDGARGWTQDADRVLIDERQLRSRLAFLFNPRAPLRINDYFSNLVPEGATDWKGRRVYAVDSKAAGGERWALYFDAGSGLLVGIGEELEIRDYRREGGVLHPVHFVVARRGGTSTYVFKDIAVNKPLDDGRFAVPSLGELFPEVFAGLDESLVLPLLKDFPSVHEDMNVPARDGRFLHDLIVRKGYKRGLEIGSFTGYSAVWMGLAFRKTGGRLVTIEYDAASGRQAQANILRAGLEPVVDARIADAFEEIPKIEGEFDFVFIDAWKPDYVRFLSLVRNRIARGGAIVGHNVTNYARDMEGYLSAIRNDPGLETTFHELSAEGMSVSIVRAPKERSGT